MVIGQKFLGFDIFIVCKKCQMAKKSGQMAKNEKIFGQKKWPNDRGYRLKMVEKVAKKAENSQKSAKKWPNDRGYL